MPSTWCRNPRCDSRPRPGASPATNSWTRFAARLGQCPADGRSRNRPRRSRLRGTPARHEAPLRARVWRAAPPATKPLVIIATSTGGPRALNELMPRLPAQLGCGVVQHMPVRFTRSLAERLDQHSPITVREAGRTDTITPDVALLAPAGFHLEVTSVGSTRLSDAPPIGGSAAGRHHDQYRGEVYRDRVLLVVLTGMGSDGETARRSQARRRAGAHRVREELRDLRHAACGRDGGPLRRRDPRTPCPWPSPKRLRPGSRVAHDGSTRRGPYGS